MMMNPELTSLYQDLHCRWTTSTLKPSDTRFSCGPMDAEHRSAVLNPAMYDMGKLEDDYIRPVDVSSIEISPILAEIPGMRELAVLQRLSFNFSGEYWIGYRASSFPSPGRIHELITKSFITPNGEQHRLRHLYETREYQEARNAALANPYLGLQILPQERIVKGLPIFDVALDALNVHRNIRDPERDAVLLHAIAIPGELIATNNIELWSNPAVVVNSEDSFRDYKIEEFKSDKRIDGRIHPKRGNLRRRGIEPYESYAQGLPRNIAEWKDLGIQTRHFLVELRGTDVSVDRQHIDGVYIDDKTLKKEKDLLRGIWGGPDGLGAERRIANHLPNRIWEINVLDS